MMSDQIFISYSSKHPVYAEMVASYLSDKFSLWIDKKNLLAGQTWEQSLIEGIIKDCFALIVIVTRDAVASSIMKVEVSTALSNNKLVIPVIMENRLNVNRCLQKIDSELARKHAINFVQDTFEIGIIKLKKQLAQEADTWAKLQNTISRLDHFSEIVRKNAVELLARTKDPRVISPLISALWIEPDWHFRLQVYIPALGEFRSDVYAFFAIFNFLEHWPEPEMMISPLSVEQVCKSLGLFGEGATHEQMVMFIEKLSSRGHSTQIKLVRLIATCRHNEALNDLAFELLFTFLRLDDERRLAAIYSLGTMGNKDAIKHILPCLIIDDERVHKAVEKGLKGLGYQGVLSNTIDQ